MSVNTKVLFDTPQREVASLLHTRLDRCKSASLIVGFMTMEGIKAIADPLNAQPSKLSNLVVGAGNYKAFEACDQLLQAGVDPASVHVHLGFTRKTGSKRGFVRYHPMLHSKVYLMEMRDGSASALVGSHNLTGFALQGLNGEAGVLLEGPSSSIEFDDIRTHIAEAVSGAVVYDPSKKEAYTWWAEQYINGLAGRFKDQPRDAENQKTMVVMAECTGTNVPGTNDVVYFEIPEAIDEFTSLRTEVHLFLFDTLPRSPAQGLNELAKANRCLKCQTRGVERDRGGLELRADWQIRNRVRPVLRKAPSPFRPSPQHGMQQIRVVVTDEALGPFEYLFDTDRATWRPSLDTEKLNPAVQGAVMSLDSPIQWPSEAWYRVNDLIRIREGEQIAQNEVIALTDMSPESGNYILMSLRRRRQQGPIEVEKGGNS